MRGISNDVIYDIELGISDKLPAQADRSEDLLVPIFRQGKVVYDAPATAIIRDFCIKQVASFVASNKKKYSIKLEPKLAAIREKLLG